MRVLKHERSSTPSVHQMEVAPPGDSSVVTHGSPAHPAVLFPSLISRAHAGSTQAAHEHIIPLVELDFTHIPHKVILNYAIISYTSVQCSSESEAHFLSFLDEQVALTLPTELVIEWRTLMRWLRGTVTCNDHIEPTKL